jgi:hypothetical protein
MKNSSDKFGNRTRDLPACSAVLQPAAPPRAHNFIVILSAGAHSRGDRGYRAAAPPRIEIWRKQIL